MTAERRNAPSPLPQTGAELIRRIEAQPNELLDLNSFFFCLAQYVSGEQLSTGLLVTEIDVTAEQETLPDWWQDALAHEIEIAQRFKEHGQLEEARVYYESMDRLTLTTISESDHEAIKIINWSSRRSENPFNVFFEEGKEKRKRRPPRLVYKPRKKKD